MIKLKKRVFITGGFGQDGKIITKLLEKEKINLHIIAKSKKTIQKNKKYFIKSDLLDNKKIEKIFKELKPDIVVHLASNNPSYNEHNHKLFYKNNLLATKNIFYSTFKANKSAKFINCSSSQIFKKKSGTVSEKSKLLPTTDYTKFRIDSHKLMVEYKKKHKIQYSNVILFNHDSIFRNKKFIIPRIARAILEKKTKFLNEIIKSNISSDFSHAEDICIAIKKLMFSKLNLDTIILSSNKLTSLNEIILYIIKKNKLDIKISYQKFIAKGLIGNNKLAKKELKWSTKKNIYHAANEIYQSYKNLSLKNTINKNNY